MNLPIIALFPGQGSQYPGMAKELKDNFPWTRQVYEEASEALKEDVFRLCLDGDESALQLTRNAQPAILVTSYAWYQVLRRELDVRPVGGAGHSLGEYTALTASGALSFASAVKLVRTRGELMQNAVPEGKGKMAAVLALTDEKVIELCEKASQGEDSLVVPANFNAPMQVVIAGHTAAVDRASVLATTPEFKARKVIPLKVSAPFHSPLMQPVAENFAAHLEAITWKPLTFPIAFNVDGKVRTNADTINLLTKQLDHSVRWTECVTALSHLGPCRFVEVGPGRVLTGLVKRILDEPRTSSVDSMEELRNFEKQLKEVVDVEG